MDVDAAVGRRAHDILARSGESKEKLIDELLELTSLFCVDNDDEVNQVGLMIEEIIDVVNEA